MNNRNKQERSKTSNQIWTWMRGSDEKPDGAMIMEQQRARMSALAEQAERLCATENARTEAVLKRLGRSVQPTPPSSQSPPQSARGCLRGRRLTPLFHVPRLNLEDMDNVDRNQRSTENSEASTHCGSSLSSVDACTPRELRDIPLIVSPTEFSSFRATPPSAPALPQPSVPRFSRRVSRLPALSAKLEEGKFGNGSGCKTAMEKIETLQEKLTSLYRNPMSSPRTTMAVTPGADTKSRLPVLSAKAKGDGCTMQSCGVKVETLQESLKRLQFDSPFVPRPPAAAERTLRAKPLAPTPPSVPQTRPRGFRRGTFILPTMTFTGDFMYHEEWVALM